MIQLVGVIVIALSVFATGFAWQMVWGFYALQPSSWVWVCNFTRAYGHPPWFLIGGLYGGFMGAFLVIMTIKVLASRVRSSSVHGNRDTDELHG